MSGVKFWTTSKHQRNGSRFAAVAVMLSLWVALWALEVSPDLHRLLHEDAQSPGHTLFSHSIPAPFVAVRLCGRCRAGAARGFERPACAVAIFSFFPAYDYRLAPSRAPPAV